MTLTMMGRFGVPVQADAALREFHVPPGRYRAPGHYAIEGDASGASYFLALGAIAGGPVRVLGVGRGSVQGDLAFTRVLEAMGAHVEMGADWVQAQGPAAPGAGGLLRAIDIDATAIPDAAMTAAVLALFARGTTRLRDIGSWRVKETDRIAAMATELGKLGATVDSGPDWLAITPPGNCGRPGSTPMTTTAWPCACRWPRRVACRAHPRPELRRQDLPRFFDDLERLCAPWRGRPAR